MASAKDVARVFEYLSLNTDGVPVEKTRLNKLLYFAQGHALVELNHELFTNQIDAWDHGPVVAVVYTGFDKIVERAKTSGIADVQLSTEEMDIIMDVWDQYRGYTAKELVDLTHEEGTPWSNTYKPTVKNVHISQDLITRYISRPENRLLRGLNNMGTIPTVSALPVEEYDPEEDSVWEALLDDTH